MPKHQTFDQAQALLCRIQDYWAERGYKVEGTIKNAGYSDRLRSTVFELETNLVAGVPRSKTGKA
ncbi:MAG: phosphoglycolate phosphatase [Pseudomonadota bacterium]